MSEQTSMPKEIVEAISQMMLKVGYVQKKGTNTFHNYKYASIEDVLEKVQPALAEVGLVISQHEVGHEIIADGNLMEAVYEFSMHRDGVSSAPIRHTGLAALRNSKGGYDDKALNKCHTAARKYFILGLFQIPTGLAADPDEDEDKPTIAKAPTQVHPAPQPSTMAGRKNEAAGQRTASQYKADCIAALAKIRTSAELTAWSDAERDTLEKLEKVSRDTHTAIMDKVAETMDRVSPKRGAAE